MLACVYRTYATRHKDVSVGLQQKDAGMNFSYELKARNYGRLSWYKPVRTVPSIRVFCGSTKETDVRNCFLENLTELYPNREPR
jgi:hypothetical protein